MDLRPLTVFVGPNNTGKSYLAILIYALHNLFGRHTQRRVISGVSDSIHFVRDRPRKVSKNDMQELLNWGINLPSNWHKKIPEFPDSFRRIIRQKIKISSRFGPHITNEFLRCFGLTSTDDFVRFGAKHGATITVDSSMYNASNCVDRIKYRLVFSANGVSVKNSAPSCIRFRMGKENYFRIRNRFSQLKWLLEDSDATQKIGRDLHPNVEPIIDKITEYIFDSIINPLSNRAYYLPADRTGLMHAHKSVTSTLIGSVATAGSRPTVEVPGLSGILTDFLSELTSFEGDSNDKDLVGLELGKQIEERVLQGSVMVTRNETGYPSFLYRPNGLDSDLPLMNSSSMVSELAPVVLHLRKIVRKGDVLIIEEPESHLHPEMQAQFSCEIARIIRSGIRIIISTHSDLILEQIGNLIRISGLPKEVQKDLTDPDSVLSPDKVGVWVFTHGRDGLGSTVEEAELDSETGLFRVGYSRVRETLYNQGATAFNLLQELK